MGPEVREGRGRGGLGGGDRLEQRGRVEKVFGAKKLEFFELEVSGENLRRDGCFFAVRRGSDAGLW